MTDANTTSIRDELLRRLYVAFFPAQEALSVQDIARERGWEEARVERTLEELSAEGFIRRRPDTGRRYGITPWGALHAERASIAPRDLAVANSRARRLLLDKYAPHSGGRAPRLHYNEILAAVATIGDIAENLVGANHQLLWDAGQINPGSGTGFFVISYEGKGALQEWRERTALLEAFEALPHAPTPQERGRRFQSLCGRLVARSDWQVEESVIAPGEEIDLFLNRQEAFYLVECRWWNEPVGAKEIRDFAGKLGQRLGVPGIFVSMSGYSADAKQLVENVTSGTPMVLVGPQEVRELFEGVLGFDDLLATKRRALISRRRADWR